MRRVSVLVLLVLVGQLMGCSLVPVVALKTRATDAPIPLAEPKTFSTWPRTTAQPIPVSAGMSRACSYAGSTAVLAGTLEVGDGSPPDPHVGQAAVVRVSPEAASAYREGRPLPTGAVVVKEKYADPAATGPLAAYAIMRKREPGFDPRGGDWEYAFVPRAPDQVVAREGLAHCAACHAAARDTDFLFRWDGRAAD